MDFDQRVSLLRERYQASLASKRVALEAAWSAVGATPEDPDARAELRSQLHRLAGSAPAYGYKALGDAAARACARLLARAEDGSRNEVGLAALEPLVGNVLHELGRLVHDVAQPGGHRPAPNTVPLRILLLEDDDEQARAIEAALVAEGCAMRCVKHVESLWEAITTWPCDALLIDYWLGNSTAESIVRLLRDEPSFSGIALLCLTVETDPARLRAVLDHGCDRVLSKRETPHAIVDAVRSVIAARSVH